MRELSRCAMAVACSMFVACSSGGHSTNGAGGSSGAGEDAAAGSAGQSSTGGTGGGSGAGGAAGASGGTAGSTTSGGAAGTGGAAGAGGTASSDEQPGLSTALFAAPPYQCLANYYVDPSGNDSGDGSAAHPWKTIQHADSSARQGGDCINVRPGTYATSNLQIAHGGSAASKTGYVVYRSTTLGGAHIVPASSEYTLLAVHDNYVMLDGFELDGNNGAAGGACVEVSTPSGGAGHHIWVMNSTVHDCGLAGLALNNSEYFYVIHNVVYGNSNTSGYQGSGISIYEPENLSGYTPTGTDLTYSPCAIVIAFNVSHDNACLTCAADGAHTDGNGIILDDWEHTQNTDAPYTGQGLVIGNLAYHNGGKGIHSFHSGRILIADNTAYANNWDTQNSGTWRGEINVQSSHDVTVTNNVAWATPGSGVLANNSPFLGQASTSNTNSWSNNISYGANNNFGSPDSFPSPANKAGVDPKLVDATGGNFALAPGSPAIGFGQAETYAPVLSADVGACRSALSTCP
jgi:parallel beta-helix repeat protein